MNKVKLIGGRLHNHIWDEKEIIELCGHIPIYVKREYIKFNSPKPDIQRYDLVYNPTSFRDEKYWYWAIEGADLSKYTKFQKDVLKFEYSKYPTR